MCILDLHPFPAPVWITEDFYGAIRDLEAQTPLSNPTEIWGKHEVLGLWPFCSATQRREMLLTLVMSTPPQKVISGAGWLPASRWEAMATC